MTLEACDMIQARSRNSVYEIFLHEPKLGRALAPGGKRFAEPIEATVSGSTFGGCTLKMGWLGIGLQMEIYANSHRTVTTPIQSLRVEPVLSVTSLDLSHAIPADLFRHHAAHRRDTISDVRMACSMALRPCSSGAR